MKIISSFDSTPIINNRWGMGNKFKETVYFTAYSLLCASSLNKDFVFYTDKTLYKVLKDLPINIELIPEDYDNRLWISSKMYAISKQTEPFIHIDTDVILYSNIINEELKNSKVICERIEQEEFNLHYKKQVDWFSQNIVSENVIWNKHLDYSYNCGTIGFTDMKIKEDFINNFNLLKNRFLLEEDKFKNLKKEDFEPCIVLEQYNLTCLLNQNNIKPYLVLKSNILEEQKKEAVQIGYTHLYGQVKYNLNVQKNIHAKLKEMFPFWYNNIKLNLANF